MPQRSTYRALPEQVLLFTVSAWDRNCPAHIPRRVDLEDVEVLLEERDRKIAELEALVK